MEKNDKKNICFILLSLLDDLITSSSYDFSYNWSRECYNFDVPWNFLCFIVVDNYYLAHVMLLRSLNWFRNEKLHIKSEIALSWDLSCCLQNLCDYSWLLVMHILSPEIGTKVELVHWFSYMCDNDIIEAPVWAYYSLPTLCDFSTQNSPLEPYLTIYLLTL